MKKFKILHVVMAKVWGGGEQYVYDVSKEMQRQGHSVVVLVDKSNCLLQQRYAEVATVVTANLYCAAGLFSVNRIKNEILNNNIDIINCHSGHGVIFCLVLKFLTGRKMILFKHNALPAKHDLYHQWLRKNTDAVICVSKLVWKLQTEGLNENEKKKFYLVYNGIDLEKFNKYSNLHKAGAEFVIGYAGRLAPNKGIDILINSFALLHAKYKNTRLKIVGADENGYLNQLCDLVNKLGLNKVVCYGGVEKDMEKFYKSLDVFVLPSVVREAFGLVLCEAMYCGVPVVTTNSGAQEEIIENGQDGIIVSAGDVEKLFEKLKILYMNLELRKAVAFNGKKKVLKNFDIKYCTGKLLIHYQEI